MPLATILTRSSSGRGSVRSTCSTEKAPNLSRATAAVTCINRNSFCNRRRASKALYRASEDLLRERLLLLTVLVFRRLDDDLLVTCHVILAFRALYVLNLHHAGSRSGGFTRI